MIGAPAAPDLRTAIEDWQTWLRGERRAALNTRTAYLGDLTRFRGLDCCGQQDNAAGP